MCAQNTDARSASASTVDVAPLLPQETKLPQEAASSPSAIEYLAQGPGLSLKTVTALVLAAIAMTFSLYHLYTAFFGQPASYLHNTLHLCLLLCLCCFLKPRGRTSWKDPANGWFFYDLACFCMAIFVQVYILYDFDAFMARRGLEDPLDVIASLCMFYLVLEATQRTLGWVLTLLVLFFLAQCLFGEYMFGIFYGPNIDWRFIITDLFMEENGIYSTPISVSASYVVMFILFGAFVMRLGVGELFQDLAYALTWRQVGGPAKTAVLSSAFMASISGSAVSNVVTTGSMTIPLMKRMGYPAVFAGAVEACASTGGVFTPPVMGAVAFVMAEFLGVSYWEVAKAAVIPALLFFTGVYSAVHFRSCKLRIWAKPDENHPTAWKILRTRGYLFLPLILLVVSMMLGYSAVMSTIVAIAFMFVLSFIDPKLRLNATGFLKIFEDAAHMMVSVAIPSAAAGIIIGSVFYSGLAVRFSNTVIELAQSSTLIALILASVICLLLGMGLTVIAVYILVASLVIPALVSLGVEPLAAHFFAFHFGVHSYITPPVALSAFAASAIAKTPPMRTGVETCRLGIAAYAIPFMFVYSPGLLGQGPWHEVLWATGVAAVGVISLAAAVEGWLAGPLSLALRLCVGVAAVAIITPTGLDQIAGLIFIILLYGWRRLRQSHMPATREEVV